MEGTLTLKTYLRREKLTVRVFGRIAGCSPATVTRACQGRNITLRIARAIERATGGKVRL